MNSVPILRWCWRGAPVLIVLSAMGCATTPAMAVNRGLLPHHPRVADAQLAVPEPRVPVSLGGKQGNRKGMSADTVRDAEKRIVSASRHPLAALPSETSKTSETSAVSANVPASPAVSSTASTSPPADSRLPFDALVRRAARATAVDAALLHAIIDTESGYDPKAISERGAIGLMQVLPQTGQRFGVRRLEDPAENVRAGASYMRWLLSRFDGDVNLALAAYNAGEGAVLRYGRQVPPFRETQNFVRKVMAGYSRLRDVGTLPTAPSGSATSESELAPSLRDLVSARPPGSNRAGALPPSISGAPRVDVIAPIDPVSMTKSNGGTRPPLAQADDAQAARAWRLLRGLGEWITRSPSAEAARVGGRDRPAVLMPSHRRDRAAAVRSARSVDGDG